MDIHHGMNPWAKDGVTPTATKFGHADYFAAKASGKSSSEIADWARANQDKMGNKGVGGDLWNTIMSAERGGELNPGKMTSGGGGSPAEIEEIHEPKRGYQDIETSVGTQPYETDFVSTANQIYSNPTAPDAKEYLARYIVDLKEGLEDRANTPETSINTVTKEPETIELASGEARTDGSERRDEPDRNLMDEEEEYRPSPQALRYDPSQYLG